MKKNKIDAVVLKETLYIGVWSAILSLVLQAVFLVIGKWDYKVLCGNLLSLVVSVLNFLIMGISLTKSLEKDEKDAKQMMKASQSLRLFALFAVIALGAILKDVCFNIWAVIIPLFFPRLAIALRPLFDKAKKGETDEK